MPSRKIVYEKLSGIKVCRCIQVCINLTQKSMHLCISVYRAIYERANQKCYQYEYELVCRLEGPKIVCQIMLVKLYRVYIQHAISVRFSFHRWLVIILCIIFPILFRPQVGSELAVALTLTPEFRPGRSDFPDSRRSCFGQRLYHPIGLHHLNQFVDPLG